MIEDVLSQDAFWIVNKKLSRKIGLVPTLVLSELLFCRKKFGNNFYVTVEDLEANLGIGRTARRSAFAILEEHNIIQITKRGQPARNYYVINDKAVYGILHEGSEGGADVSSEVETDVSSEVETDPTYTKNINKNINKKDSETKLNNNLPFDYNTTSSLKGEETNDRRSFVNNQGEDASGDGETRGGHTPAIGENPPRIDTETSDGSLGYPRVQKPKKAPQNRKEGKLPKSFIDQYYDICAFLNAKYGIENYWDPVETKALKAQVKESEVPVDIVLDYSDKTKQNPAWKLLEPLWRLEDARTKNPSNGFFLKPFRPSILSKRYIQCLPPFEYEQKKSGLPEETRTDWEKLKRINEQLISS